MVRFHALPYATQFRGAGPPHQDINDVNLKYHKARLLRAHSADFMARSAAATAGSSAPDAGRSERRALAVRGGAA